MKIVSKLSPPTEAYDLFYTLRTRDGRDIEYQCGGGLTMHERYRECGGCSFCLGEVWFSNPARRYSRGSSHPKFYRFPCEPCESCKPKLARLSEIDRLIFDLEKERRSLE